MLGTCTSAYPPTSTTQSVLASTTEYPPTAAPQLVLANTTKYPPLASPQAYAIGTSHYHPAASQRSPGGPYSRYPRRYGMPRWEYHCSLPRNSLQSSSTALACTCRREWGEGVNKHLQQRRGSSWEAALKRMRRREAGSDIQPCTSQTYCSMASAWLGQLPK
jgi:hypothetical protein